jgi:hypothetical protein
MAPSQELTLPTAPVSPLISTFVSPRERLLLSLWAVLVVALALARKIIDNHIWHVIILKQN